MYDDENDNILHLQEEISDLQVRINELEDTVRGLVTQMEELQGP